VRYRASDLALKARIEELEAEVKDLGEHNDKLGEAIVATEECLTVMYHKERSALDRIEALEAELDEALPRRAEEVVRIAKLEARLAAITALVARQAEDEALWFAGTAPEAYVQQALRELHMLIEGGSDGR